MTIPLWSRLSQEAYGNRGHRTWRGAGHTVGVLPFLECGAPTPTFRSLYRRVGTEEEVDVPLLGMPGRWGWPLRCAPPCGAHAQSPVLIPRLLRSWTMSSVRPGHSPALSTPMLPEGPGTLSRRLSAPLSGGSTGAEGGSSAEGGDPAGCRVPRARLPGTHRRFRLPGSGVGPTAPSAGFARWTRDLPS